jgi:16S rRNA (adenine1518-N6/adenine1519-N6)-dimethyltransferase
VVRLRRRWPAERLRLHEADALDFDFAALAGDGRLRLVGNLPYNISTPLLIRLLAFRERIVDAHFMLQKEVVDRIVAPPGTTRLRSARRDDAGVLPRAFADRRAARGLRSAAEVDSSVMRMAPRPVPLVADAATLERLMSVALRQRRKMLRGTVLPWLRAQGIDPDDARFALVPTARPEEVPVERWAAIADALSATRSGAPTA